MKWWKLFLLCFLLRDEVVCIFVLLEKWKQNQINSIVLCAKNFLAYFFEENVQLDGNITNIISQAKGIINKYINSIMMKRE